MGRPVDGTGNALVFVALTTIVTSLAMVAVHEGGHALGGIMAGFRF